MPGRRTNLALLALTVLAVISGFAAFAVGTPAGTWIVVAHGLMGLSILVLVPWKTTIVRRGLTRGPSSRSVSIALSIVISVTIASGVVLITGLVDRVGPFTTMQVHVTAGIVTLALTGWHVAARSVKPRAADLSRRNALRATGLLGAAGLLYVGTESLLAATGAAGADRRFTGSHDIGDTERVPPTQWLNDRVQRLDRESHVVDVLGESHTTEDIERFEDAVTATLDCTGGWHATRSWSGARLDRLIGDVSGTSLIVRSVTGYWRRFPLSQAADLWLATRLDGDRLAAGNGAPVRLVAPGRRGFWWVKWVREVEVDDLPPWWQPPLPMA